MTVRHVNALLSQVLKSAVLANLIASSPIAKAQTKPKKPKRSKIEVLDESSLLPCSTIFAVIGSICRC